METIIKNAIITSSSIKLDRDYFLSVWLSLRFDSYSQNFGGYVLGKIDEVYAKDMGNHAGIFIMKCMKVAGVTDWGDVVGKAVRIKTTEGWNAEILGVGHVVNDEWLIPSELFGK